MQNTTKTAIFSLLLTACSPEKKTDSTETNTQQATSDEELPDSASDTNNETAEPDPEYNIWNGPTITFTKENDADFTLPANQDTITDKVILTRGERGSLFNVTLETSASSTSPEGTEWAKGTTANMDALEFKPLKSAADQNMQDVPGMSFVLHLIEEDVYLDVTFLQWTSSANGSGFSYERSTEE